LHTGSHTITFADTGVTAYKEYGRDVLLYQLAQISKPGSELVDTVININPSNDDGLLLVLGALARNNDNAIQSVVVGELLRRLETVKAFTNNTESIILLNYALSNTGSRLTIDALLSSLGHDDIDTQISVIRGLGVHLNQPAVQKALIILLNGTKEDNIFEEVITTLKAAHNDKIMVDPSEGLLDTIVKTAVRLENPNLYEMLIYYLILVGTDEAQQHISILQQQYSYGQVSRDRVSDNARIKRGSDWDESNYDYDLIASYSQRRNDVIDYPYHKGYLWAKTFGISDLNMKMATGTFIGGYWNDYTKRLKMRTKAVARANVLGYSFDIADIEFSDRTSGTTLYHRVYVKLGSIAFLNTNSQHTTCLSSSKRLFSHDHTVFIKRYPVFVYITVIWFTLDGIVTVQLDGGHCVCPSVIRACANLVPSLSLTIKGTASTSLAVSIIIIA